MSTRSGEPGARACDLEGLAHEHAIWRAWRALADHSVLKPTQTMTERASRKREEKMLKMVGFVKTECSPPCWP